MKSVSQPCRMRQATQAKHGKLHFLPTFFKHNFLNNCAPRPTKNICQPGVWIGDGKVEGDGTVGRWEVMVLKLMLIEIL